MNENPQNNRQEEDDFIVDTIFRNRRVLLRRNGIIYVSSFLLLFFFFIGTFLISGLSSDSFERDDNSSGGDDDLMIDSIVSLPKSSAPLADASKISDHFSLLDQKLIRNIINSECNLYKESSMIANIGHKNVIVNGAELIIKYWNVVDKKAYIEIFDPEAEEDYVGVVAFENWETVLVSGKYIILLHFSTLNNHDNRALVKIRTIELK